jgi:hypothetical protein
MWRRPEVLRDLERNEGCLRLAGQADIVSC